MTHKDDENLWDLVTQDVKPLHPSKKNVSKKEETPKANTSKTTLKKSLKTKDPIPRTTAIIEKSREIDKNTKDKLIKGKLKIEGRIDLHGMRQEEAYRSLSGFIESSYNSGRRMVLVITGKGAQSVNPEHWMEDARGVLKRKFPTWMQQIPFKDIVLQYHHARPRDGGDGAFYVYLRKNK